MFWPFTQHRPRPRRGAPAPPAKPAPPAEPIDDGSGRAGSSSAPAPTAPPAGARPAPRPVPPPITGPPPRVRPVSFIAPPPKPAAAPAPPKAAAAPLATGAPVDIRIPFARVAAQLPRDVFLESMDRLGQSLREPNVLVIPARLVTSQLAEGVVEVDWAVIEPQFPELASALPTPELRARFVGWRLALPMDEVVRQLSPGVLGGATSVTPSGIEAFPPPFQPFSGGSGSTRSPATSASTARSIAAPPGVAAPGAAPAGAAPPGAGLPASPITPLPTPARAPSMVAHAPRVAPSPPLPLTSPVPTPLPSSQIAPAKLAAPTPPPPLSAPPQTAPAPPPPAPALPQMASAPPQMAPAPPAAPSARATDAAIAEAKAVAGELARGAPFDTTVGVREGVTIAAFTAAGVSPDIAERVGRRAGPLIAGGACVALRAALASVVTARGRHGILAAALRPPAPIAWADSVLAHAAVGPGASPPDDAASLSPATDARLAEAAAVFGGDAPASGQAFADPGRGLSLSVVAAADARAAAAVARRVWEVLLRAPDAALGAVVWVTVRRGREVTIVRPLAGANTHLLVAVGDAERLGLAHRQAERAAAILEGR